MARSAGGEGRGGGAGWVRSAGGEGRGGGAGWVRSAGGEGQSASRNPQAALVRTRFAPSPTGHLHVGGARTAILNWLFARHYGGAFVLRVEDTDAERNRPGAEAELLADLRWLGLDWDEGPDVGGDFAPYRQSERGELYGAHAERLLAAGHAYWCTCPPAPADVAPEGAPARARCACAERTGALANPAPGRASLRFRVPDEIAEVRVHDVVRGEVAFPRAAIEDFVLLRSDGRATYNFAATADDAAMRITHVVRGADHLVNTPKQQLLYAAFGWPTPVFAHVPLILGADRQKLSKRHGATSVAAHRRAGYLPEAMLNYLSLLAWSSPSGEELLSQERLIAEVDLARVGASDAVFDWEKLRWMSAQYIQALGLDELLERLQPFLDRERFPLPPEALRVAVAALRARLHTLGELNDVLPLLLGPRTPEQWQARARAVADAATHPVLAAVRARLAALPAWEEEALNAAVRAAGAEAGAKGRALFQPVRLALSGEEHGPELAKLLVVLGRERALRLLDAQFAEDAFDAP